jgi:hypothetical protein
MAGIVGLLCFYRQEVALAIFKCFDRKHLNKIATKQGMGAVFRDSTARPPDGDEVVF